MNEGPNTHDPKRLLVVMPTWLGDCVMAMPTLHALRTRFPNAHITTLLGPNVKPIVEPNPWSDRSLTARVRQRKGAKRTSAPIALANRLKAGQFDAAVLLPNSFRTALIAAMANIPKRVGYDRDGRGFLLTDRLIPRRTLEGFVPVSTRDYYLGLAHYLGCVDTDPALQLFTRTDDDQRALGLLHDAGYDPDSEQRFILLNPGANYGDAKMWFPDRYAQLADILADKLNAFIAVSGAPKERAILDKVIDTANTPIFDLAAAGMSLGTLKSIVRLASVMVTNDTGPRHIAAALGTPVVTIFGPTDPAWTVINFEHERQVMEKVFCGPCQKKKCPLDHRCMTRIEPDRVSRVVIDLLNNMEAHP